MQNYLTLIARFSYHCFQLTNTCTPSIRHRLINGISPRFEVCTCTNNWFSCDLRRHAMFRCNTSNGIATFLGVWISPESISASVKPWHMCEWMMTSSNGNIIRVTGPLCGEFTGPGEFPTQRPVTRSFDVFFDLRLNKRLSKQPQGWWFETPT